MRDRRRYIRWVFEAKKRLGLSVLSLTFVDKVKSELGFKAVHRKVTEATVTYTLREQTEAYGPVLSAKVRR
jgi:hypothetical protein